MPPSLKWGIETESKAIGIFIEMYKNTYPFKGGFVVSPKWPWLGCSPDGNIVEEDRLKCPYSKRDITLQEATESDKSFFSSVDGNTLALTKKHAYYYQCQGVLNIC